MTINLHDVGYVFLRAFDPAIRIGRTLAIVVGIDSKAGLLKIKKVDNGVKGKSKLVHASAFLKASQENLLPADAQRKVKLLRKFEKNNAEQPKTRIKNSKKSR